MGNCLQPSTAQPFEVQLPPPSPSEVHSVCADFPASKRVSLASGPAGDSFAAGQSGEELRKSLGSLGKQLEEGRNWQEGSGQTDKFSRVLARTHRLEAKIEKLQRRSLNPSDLSIHKAEKDDYLALERELQVHMDVILEDMSDVKADVADLELHVQELKAKSLTRTHTN